MGTTGNGRGGVLDRLVLVLIVIAGLGAAVWWYLASHRGVQYTIVFQNAQAVRRGDPVTLAGIQAGEVVAVEYNADDGRATVRIRVEPDFQDKIQAPPNSSARIIDDGWLFSGRRVDIVNRAGDGAPLQGGEVVDGLDSWAASKIFDGTAKAGELVSGGKDALGDFAEMAQDQLSEIDDWAKEMELKRKVAEVRDNLKESTTSAGEDARVALDKAMEKAKEVTADLQTMGRSDLAAGLEDTMVGVREKAQELWETKKPKPTPEPTPTPTRDRP